MHTKSVLKKLLNVDNKIVMKDTYFDELRGEEILVLSVRPTKREMNHCPICNRVCPGYDNANKLNRWRSLDFGTHRVYIESVTPRVKCREHGVIIARVQWARHDSAYTRDLVHASCNNYRRFGIFQNQVGHSWFDC